MADTFHEEEVLGKAYDSRLMRRLLEYLRPYWLVVLVALVATLLYGVLQAVPPYLMKVEVDRYLDPTGRAELPHWLARFLSSSPLVGISQIAFAFFLPTVIATFFLEFVLTFSVLPLIVLTTMAFRQAVRQSYRKIRVAIARINAYLQEHLTGMAVLQLFNREARSFEEFGKINRTHMEAYKDSILAYGLFYPAVEFLGVAAVSIILY